MTRPTRPTAPGDHALKAHDVSSALQALIDPEKADFFPRFFKVGKGQYGEGDKFLGVSVPQQRLIVKRFQAIPLAEIPKLLKGEWHEERLTGLLLLVSKYSRGDLPTKQACYDMYLAHAAYINNWDLVDSSADIVGSWLQDRPEKLKVLQQLAHSDSLWERRIAMIATFTLIKQGEAHDAIVIAEILLHDKHDLIQKAVGWMLREMGKRVDRQVLLAFLDQHAADMPRTTLRYAIEHLDPEMRKHYMGLAGKDKTSRK